VAEPFLDYLEVSSAREEPGCVGVAQAVHLDVDVKLGLGEGRL
jgi:hypothetical protein